MQTNLKQSTFKGVFWKLGERMGSQLMLFIIGIVLARLLSPEEFGIIGMLAVFIAVAQEFIDSGFSVALIRKSDASDEDFSTAFWFNTFIAIIAYFILFLSAPFIARFYNQPILINLTRVLTINLLINAFGAVQRTIYIRNIDFKTQAVVNLVSVLIGGIVGIIMAFKGFGVWSLVGKNLTQTLLINSGFWITSSWRPKLIFAWNSFKKMFKFGSNLLFSGLLSTVINNLYNLVIGKLFSAESLGYFTRAKQFNTLPISTIQGVGMNVMFPVLSKLQDDDVRLKAGYRKFLLMISFLLFPIMAYMAIFAKSIIIVLVTDKWLPAVPLLQVLSLFGILIPLHSINVNILLVKGRSDIVLILDIIKIALLAIAIIISYRWGVIGLVWGMVVQSAVVYYIHCLYSNKFMYYPIQQQLFDLRKTFFSTIIMMIPLYLINIIIKSELISLITGGVALLLFYYGINVILKSEEIKDVKSFALSVLFNR